MSRHMRFYFASLVVVGGLAAAPACSDPFTDLFNIAPREPAATPSVQLLAAARQFAWARSALRDGHRECWFLAESIATVRKRVHGRVANLAASPDENEAAPPRPSPVIDARAELLSSSPADGAHPMPSAREVKVADAASVFDAGAPPLTPAAPTADLPPGQLTPQHSMPSQVDVEKLAVAARAD